MSDHYILDGHTPVSADLMTWARWMDKADRIVAQTGVNGAKVSTVFIGLDHQHVPGGPLQIFETMIFGGPHDGYCERYATWPDAEAGHAHALTVASTQEEVPS